MYSQPWSPTPSTTALDARVAHGEALAGQAAEERPAAGGAVEHGVADDHVLLGAEAGAVGRAHGDHAAGHALARVVVGVAPQRERHAGRQPGAEATGRPSRGSATSIVPSGRPSAPCARAISLDEQAADRAVDVARSARSRPTGSPRSSAGRAALDQLLVERVVEHRVRRRAVRRRAARRPAPRARRAASVRSTPLRLPVLDRRRRPRAGRRGRSAPRSVRTPSDAMMLAHLLGHHEQEVDDVLGLAAEALAQLGVLRRDARPGRC